MAKPSSERIVLIGAGLAGSLLAVYLARRGYAVDLYERRPDMRKVKISAGRSINLALSTRGIHALKEVGLYEAISKIAIAMKGRMVHAPGAPARLQPYGKDDREVINAVSRAELNIKLMDLAEEHDGIRIHFNQRCTGMNFDTGEVYLIDEKTKKARTARGETVIGTDGSASAIRTDMLRAGRFNFSQRHLEHGYKELVIPPGPDGEFRMERHALHIWPRKTYMLIALPNLDGSFTCTLFYPFAGDNSFESLKTSEQLRAFFTEQFPDAVPMMPTLTEDFFGNPTGSLVTVHCDPWHFGGKVALLGDAAHAIVPFFGQGMNCAFEDCTVLNQCIDRHAGDWAGIFKEYEAQRKKNTDAIADLAVENFFEMRDLVADPRFILKKQIEHLLEDKFPEHFVPKYSMVTFHRISYSVARKRGRIQEEILDELCSDVERADQVDLEKASRLILLKLPEPFPPDQRPE